MDKETILNIFYNQVLKDAVKGEIIIDDWHYAMNFSCNLEEKQTNICIQIHDKERFDNLLYEYSSLMFHMLKNDSFYHSFDNIFFSDGEKANQHTLKAILTFVWANAGFSDFLEPEKFLERRIEFIKNKEYLNFSSEDGYLCSLLTKYGELPLYAKIKKNSPVLENLYSFSSFLVSPSGEQYSFPDIYYGIAFDTCYIGGIQKKKVEKNKFQKDMDRFFYGVDHEVPNELKNIPPNLLVALVIFFEVLKQNQIFKVSFESFYPLRNQMKEHQIEKFQKLSEEDYLRVLNHTINRESLAFTRLNYHFGEGVEITSYPFDVDSAFHLVLQDREIVHPNLLTDIVTSFPKNEQKKI